ncbi:MAG: DNA-deoxyinosine glycosylase [Lentisphaeria bacterium]|nr:DNA-deoxyinosine glycosylase [Lentisphaeria bacterium]
MNGPELKRSFPPMAGENPRVLILGSLPGEESLRQQQYYAYRHNAFWRIMGGLLGFDHTIPYEERLAALRKAGVALWDTIGAGRRKGSLDTQIRDIEPNPVAELLAKHPTIRFIGCNGGKAFEQLKRSAPELFEEASLTIVRLPSTSPAAAAMRFEQKRDAWKAVAEFLQKTAPAD